VSWNRASICNDVLHGNSYCFLCLFTSVFLISGNPLHIQLYGVGCAVVEQGIVDSPGTKCAILIPLNL